MLAATYLASVLTPCLVTALAIAREQSWRTPLLVTLLGHDRRAREVDVTCP